MSQLQWFTNIPVNLNSNILYKIRPAKPESKLKHFPILRIKLIVKSRHFTRTKKNKNIRRFKFTLCGRVLISRSRQRVTHLLPSSSY